MYIKVIKEKFDNDLKEQFFYMESLDTIFINNINHKKINYEMSTL